MYGRNLHTLTHSRTHTHTVSQSFVWDLSDFILNVNLLPDKLQPRTCSCCRAVWVWVFYHNAAEFTCCGSMIVTFSGHRRKGKKTSLSYHPDGSSWAVQHAFKWSLEYYTYKCTIDSIVHLQLKTHWLIDSLTGNISYWEFWVLVLTHRSNRHIILLGFKNFKHNLITAVALILFVAMLKMPTIKVHFLSPTWASFDHFFKCIYF